MQNTSMEIIEPTQIQSEQEPLSQPIITQEVSEKTEDLECKKCGWSNPIDSKFCNRCGTSLSTVCSNCGNKNSSDASFCNECGARIKEIMRDRTFPVKQLY